MAEQQLPGGAAGGGNYGDGGEAAAPVGAEFEDWGPPPTFPRLRIVMGLVGGLTLAAFIYHSLSAASRWRQQRELREREDRYVGFLHREEANTRLVNGDLPGAIEHYTEAARLALRGSQSEDAESTQHAHEHPDMGGHDDDDEAHHHDGRATIDPAFAAPDLDFAGTEAWALALIQRAAAHWSAADIDSCARDALAVLRVYAPSVYVAHDEDDSTADTKPATSEVGPDNGAGILGGDGGQDNAKGDETTEATGSGEAVPAAASENNNPETEKDEEEEKKKKEEEEAAKLDRQHRDRQKRITARAAELLGRCLSANQGQEPWSTLLALNLCVKARPGSRPVVAIQLEHLRDKLHAMLLPGSERPATTVDGADAEHPVRYPVKIANDPNEFNGLLVATETIEEGTDILVETPFIVAPWRRSRAEGERRVRGPICQASEWLLHDRILSPSLAEAFTKDSTISTAMAVEGDEEDRCLFLLAKRVFACLAAGQKEERLQPLWSTVASLIKSLPSHGGIAAEKPQQEDLAQISEQEWQSVVKHLQDEGAEQKDETTAPTLEEWNGLVNQLRCSALRIVRHVEKSDHQQQPDNSPSVECRGLGLYLLGSHVGKSSVQPNARAHIDEARASLRLVALRTIAAGEPITVFPHA